MFKGLSVDKNYLRADSAPSIKMLEKWKHLLHNGSVTGIFFMDL